MPEKEFHMTILGRTIEHLGTQMYKHRAPYQLMVPYWPDVARNHTETGAIYDFARVFDSLDKVV